MTVVYPAALRNERLEAVRTAVDGARRPGAIEIGTDGMRQVLAAVPLRRPCGKVLGGELVFDVAGAEEDARWSGRPAEARIVDGDGSAVVTGLRVGDDVLISAERIRAGQRVAVVSARILHA